MSFIDQFGQVLDGAVGTLGLIAQAAGVQAPFMDRLRQASFRGVPFGVMQAEIQAGRRLAKHEYPKADKVYIEDMGRRTRAITFVGFLVSNSAVYGGGLVEDQMQALVAACETKGKATLVHPSLGRMTVECEVCAIQQRMEKGEYAEVRFVFYESGQIVFPTVTASTTAATGIAALAAQAQAALSFANQAAVQVQQAAATVQNAVSTINGWTSQAQALGFDAAGIFKLASQLSGNYGRYFNGANAGGFPSSGAPTLDPTVTTVEDLVLQAANQRAALTAAAAAVGPAMSGQGASAAATAAQTLVQTLAGNVADPADAIRLLTQLAQYAPPVTAASTPIGGLVGDLFRRQAVIALAQTTMIYQPSSQDDANQVRLAVASLISTEAQKAADQAEDAVFDALRAMRTAVIQDLKARGADLAPITTFAPGANLPAVVLAWRYYRDATRADQLVAQVNPVHPLFMPTAYQALAS